ncbi:MAG: hypothetical protein ACFFD4_29670 [Candidatus Odinarchaeota archaeon]
MPLEAGTSDIPENRKLVTVHSDLKMSNAGDYKYFLPRLHASRQKLTNQKY